MGVATQSVCSLVSLVLWIAWVGAAHHHRERSFDARMAVDVGEKASYIAIYAYKDDFKLFRFRRNFEVTNENEVTKNGIIKFYVDDGPHFIIKITGRYSGKQDLELEWEECDNSCNEYYGDISTCEPASCIWWTRTLTVRVRDIQGSAARRGCSKNNVIHHRYAPAKIPIYVGQEASFIAVNAYSHDFKLFSRNFEVTNENEVTKNGIIKFYVDDGPHFIIKITGRNPGKQDLVLEWEECDNSCNDYYKEVSTCERYSCKCWARTVTVHVSEVEGAAAGPGCLEYTFYRDVFLSLNRSDLWQNYQNALNEIGRVNWSRVWGERLGYGASLRRISQMLHDAHNVTRDDVTLNRHLEQIREVIAYRLRDTQIIPQSRRDEGHAHTLHIWQMLQIVSTILLVFGAEAVTDGLATPEVLAFLAREGIQWADIAPFFSSKFI